MVCNLMLILYMVLRKMMLLSHIVFMPFILSCALAERSDAIAPVCANAPHKPRAAPD